MLIDFGAVLTDLDGTPMTEKGLPATLATVVVNALLATYADEPNLQGTDKIRRYDLALRVHKSARGNGECDVSFEETAEIERLIIKAFPPLIVGRALGLIRKASQ